MRILLLWIGVLALVGQLLIPPWRFRHPGMMTHTARSVRAAYAPFWKPPQIPITSRSSDGAHAYYDGWETSSWFVEVDYERMVFPSSAVILVFGALWITLTKRERGTPLSPS